MVFVGEGLVIPWANVRAIIFCYWDEVVNLSRCYMPRDGAEWCDGGVLLWMWKS